MEFQEVCRHISSMCKIYRYGGGFGCTGCPMINLKAGLCDIMPKGWDGLVLKKAERIVTEWAKEHPEPVYETWYDYLTEIGLFESLGRPATAIISQALKSHIPPDIGKKLGLKPVNGSDG